MLHTAECKKMHLARLSISYLARAVKARRSRAGPGGGVAPLTANGHVSISRVPAGRGPPAKNNLPDDLNQFCFPPSTKYRPTIASSRFSIPRPLACEAARGSAQGSPLFPSAVPHSPTTQQRPLAGQTSADTMPTTTSKAHSPQTKKSVVQREAGPDAWLPSHLCATPLSRSHVPPSSVFEAKIRYTILSRNPITSVGIRLTGGVGIRAGCDSTLTTYQSSIELIYECAVLMRPAVSTRALRPINSLTASNSSKHVVTILRCRSTPNVKISWQCIDSGRQQSGSTLGCSNCLRPQLIHDAKGITGTKLM